MLVMVSYVLGDCLFQFNLMGMVKFILSCDIVKVLLVKVLVNYELVEVMGVIIVIIGDMVILFYDVLVLLGEVLVVEKVCFDGVVSVVLGQVGYLLVVMDNIIVVKVNYFFDIFIGQKLMIVIMLIYLILLVMMVYGFIVVVLVELFLICICYFGLFLFYYIGNGWFGGLLFVIVFVILVQIGNIYVGLWYVIVVVLMMVVIGMLFVLNGMYKKDIFVD